eukprot:462771-Prorocentrum_minimum.AAC.1
MNSRELNLDPPRNQKVNEVTTYERYPRGPGWGGRRVFELGVAGDVADGRVPGDVLPGGVAAGGSARGARVRAGREGEAEGGAGVCGRAHAPHRLRGHHVRPQVRN